MFFDEDFEGILVTKWYGISFQLEKIRNEKLYKAPNHVVTQSIDFLESSFKKLVLRIDQDNSWIINHDDKDMSWFLKEDSNVPRLRDLFKQNGIPGNYKGCLIVYKDDLLRETL